MRSIKWAWLVAVCLLVACTMKPASRMDAYLGPASNQESVAFSQRLAAMKSSLEAGILLINDTTGQDSAPALSPETKAFLANQVKQRVGEKLPIRVTKDLSTDAPLNGQAPTQLQQLSRDNQLPYLLLAVFSSEESEIPVFVPLTGDPEQGGTRPKVLGFEAINYALAELALLDAESGQVVLRSDGRAWARLNRLKVPVESNAYPVIHRSLRVAPIYPKEENAKDVLRSIAGDEALEQAVMHLQEQWPKPAPS